MGLRGLRHVSVAAVVVALACAWVGSFAATRLGWEFAPDLPSGLAANELSATAFPGMQVWGGGNAPIVEPFGDGEGVKYGSVSYWVKHTDKTKDVEGYTAGARERLAAAGWQIHPFVKGPNDPLDAEVDETKAGFWATRPGLVLNFSDYYWSGRPAYDSTGAAAFDLWRAPAWWLGFFTWGGLAAGAALGYLLTMWVRHSIHRIPGLSLAFVALTGLALTLLLPTALGVGEEQPMDSPWWGGFYYFGRETSMYSAAIAVFMLLVTVALQPAVRAFVKSLVGRIRRRPKTAAAVAVIALAAAVLPSLLPGTGVVHPPCHPPAGVPAEPAAADLGDSPHVKVFIANNSTDQQRALVDAAIFRSRAGGIGELVWQPDSTGFRETYCGGAPVPAAAVASLPYYFDVDLNNIANYPALLEEVKGQAGVLAVQRALRKN